MSNVGVRVVTWNLNGLRSAAKRGLDGHVRALRADVLLFQEVRATVEQAPPGWTADELAAAGWGVAWNAAEKAGYAGTALLARTKLEAVATGIGGPDPEGRVVGATLSWGPGRRVRAVSVYLPSGSSGEHRQAEKEAWMKQFGPWAERVARSRTPVLLCGDFNIAHQECDIWNPKGNAKNSGFLPHERSWFGGLLGVGWRDVVRERCGVSQGPYSWWSNRGQARALDRGWRIDYVLANRAAWGLVRGAGIERSGGLEVSDHAPVWVDLAWD